MSGFLTLGIETSCDETSAAVLEGADRLLSNVVTSQVEVHAKFGGVVPEIAGRKHTEAINIVLREALERADVGFGDIDLVAVTVGPGLVVSLVVGIAAARAVAAVIEKPLVGVNHLEGHLLANCIGNSDCSFPAVCLLVSGGHTEIVLIEQIGHYKRLGGTVDDAAGEAFDKIARLLNLGYPGGPIIQKSAESGDPGKVKFPRPMLREDNFNLSFSGLKTAVINFIRNNEKLIGTKITMSDLAASFQEAVVDVLAGKTMRAAENFGVSNVWLAGGVAANKVLRERMKKESEKRNIRFFTPDFILCTDSAGMIARAGYEVYSGNCEKLALSPQPGLILQENRIDK
jgi:N6-L-threonylcarbamoyladenine synthase